MAKYQFHGSFSQDFYAPTHEQSQKPHIIVIEIAGKGIAVSQPFRTYLGAVRNITEVVFDIGRQYDTNLREDEASIMPLSELPVLMPSFRGMTQAQMVKKLKGWAHDSDETSKKKTKKESLPFGL